MNVLLIPVGDYCSDLFPTRYSKIFERIHGNSICVHVINFHRPAEKTSRKALIHYMPVTHTHPLKNYFLNNRIYLTKIKQLLTSNEIDVIVTANQFYLYVRRFLNIIESLRIPIVVDLADHPFIIVTNILPKAQLPKSLQQLGSALLWSLANPAFSKSDRITVASKELFHLLDHKFGDKSVYIPNGVDNYFFEKGNGELIRSLFSLKKEDLLVGFVGAVESWVKVNDLMIAIKKTSKFGVSVYLLIVGTGSKIGVFKTFAKKLNIRNRLLLAGVVNHRKIKDYIAACDLCVIPFDPADIRTRFSSPIKLWEYLAQGKPVLSSDFPEARYYGNLLTIVKNSNDYVKAFVNYSKNPYPYIRIAQMGKKFAKSMTWDNSAYLMKKTLAEVI